MLTNEGAGVGEADTEEGGRGGQTHRHKKGDRKIGRKAERKAAWGKGRQTEGQRRRERQETRERQRFREKQVEDKRPVQQPLAGS